MHDKGSPDGDDRATEKHMDDKAIRDILWAIPDSYIDFVNATARHMEEDEILKEAKFMGMTIAY